MQPAPGRERQELDQARRNSPGERVRADDPITDPDREPPKQTHYD